MTPYLPLYRKFLLVNSKRIISPAEFWSQSNSSLSGLLIKHDVECCLDRAVEMAKLECAVGIKSVYLLQVALLKPKNVNHLRDLESLGHEIGYHYDVLDNNSGDYECAKREFERNLLLFQSYGITVRFVCPHGNPSLKRSGYSSNKDFWIKYGSEYVTKNIYDLVMNFEGVSYSDVGYGFSRISRSGDKKEEEIVSYNYANQIVDKTGVISIHSHRWSGLYTVAYYRKFRFLVVRNIYSILKKYKIIRLLGNYFFKLAKFV